MYFSIRSMSKTLHSELARVLVINVFKLPRTKEQWSMYKCVVQTCMCKNKGTFYDSIIWLQQTTSTVTTTVIRSLNM